jgi:hypothetical protein
MAFFVIGAYALRIYFGFLSRVLAGGHFDCSRNNSLAQMMASFSISRWWPSGSLRRPE